MNIVGKVTPKIYEILRASGKSSIVELKPTKIPLGKDLKFDINLTNKLRYSDNEIASAYKMYAKSPYVNYYLRNGETLSEEGNKIVSSLKQGVENSSPKSGKFYRGLHSCPDEETAGKFVFDNCGFTSVTPESAKAYADTFALGKNGAVIEYDLKTPIKGYQQNNYEILFNPDSFNREKYEITKVKDGYYRVTEKVPKGNSLKHAMIYSQYSPGDTLVIGWFPENYVRQKKVFYEAHTYTERFGPNKGKVVNMPAKWDTERYMLPHYHIDKLWTGGKGTGTTAVQDVVQRSLKDSRTAGRVTLDACCIDGKTCPSGFYYKLGFRFGNNYINEIFEKWLKEGGARENAPSYTGLMFLPLENIQQCLNYVPHHL